MISLIESSNGVLTNANLVQNRRDTSNRATTSVLFVDVNTLLHTQREWLLGDKMTGRPISLESLMNAVAKYINDALNERPDLAWIVFSAENMAHASPLRRAEVVRKVFFAVPKGAEKINLHKRPLRSPYSRTYDTAGFIPMTMADFKREQRTPESVVKLPIGTVFTRGGTDLDALLSDPYVLPVLLSMLFEIVLEAFSRQQKEEKRNVRITFTGAIYNFAKLCSEEQDVLLPNDYTFNSDGTVEGKILNATLGIGETPGLLCWAIGACFPSIKAGQRIQMEVISTSNAVATAAALNYASNETPKIRIIVRTKKDCVFDAHQLLWAFMPAALKWLCDFTADTPWKGGVVFVMLALLYFSTDHTKAPAGFTQTPKDFARALVKFNTPRIKEFLEIISQNIRLEFDKKTNTVNEISVQTNLIGLLFRALWAAVADISLVEATKNWDKKDQDTLLPGVWQDYLHNTDLFPPPHPLRDWADSPDWAVLAANVGFPTSIIWPAQIKALTITLAQVVTTDRTGTPQQQYDPVETDLPIPLLDVRTNDAMFPVHFPEIMWMKQRFLRYENAVEIDVIADAIEKYRGWGTHWSDVDAQKVPFPGDFSRPGAYARACFAQWTLAMLTMGHSHKANTQFVHGITDVIQIDDNDWVRRTDVQHETKFLFKSKFLSGDSETDVLAPLRHSGLFLNLEDSSGDVANADAEVIAAGVVAAALQRDQEESGEDRAIPDAEVDLALDAILTRFMDTAAPNWQRMPLLEFGILPKAARPFLLRLVVVEAHILRQIVAEPIAIVASRAPEEYVSPTVRAPELDPLVNPSISSGELGELFEPFAHRPEVDEWIHAPKRGTFAAAPVRISTTAGWTGCVESIDKSCDMALAHVAALHDRAELNDVVTRRETLLGVPHGWEGGIDLRKELKFPQQIEGQGVPYTANNHILSFCPWVVSYALPMLRCDTEEKEWTDVFVPRMALIRQAADRSYSALCRWKASETVLAEASLEVQGEWKSPYLLDVMFYGSEDDVPPILAFLSQIQPAPADPATKWYATWVGAMLALNGVPVGAAVYDGNDIVTPKGDSKQWNLARILSEIAPWVFGIKMRLEFVPLQDGTNELHAHINIVGWPEWAALHYIMWVASTALTKVRTKDQTIEFSVFLASPTAITELYPDTDGRVEIENIDYIRLDFYVSPEPQ